MLSRRDSVIFLKLWIQSRYIFNEMILQGQYDSFSTELA